MIKVTVDGSGYLAKAMASAKDAMITVINERVRAIALGQKAFGRYGSADHQRYAQEQKSRKRCKCGNRVTHAGMANGVALMGGCEWCVLLWVEDPHRDKQP